MVRPRILSEVAHVRDGFSPQTNIVRQNGQRGVLLSIIKNGGASTLDVVKGILSELPSLQQQMPQDLKITPLFDQSTFVRAAVSGVVREALIAAGLTAILILLFLGNWRSTCIIAVSIPLSILSSIIALDLMGETLNIMTLGGLALAVGTLVSAAQLELLQVSPRSYASTAGPWMSANVSSDSRTALCSSGPMELSLNHRTSPCSSCRDTAWPRAGSNAARTLCVRM